MVTRPTTCTLVARNASLCDPRRRTPTAPQPLRSRGPPVCGARPRPGVPPRGRRKRPAPTRSAAGRWSASRSTPRPGGQRGTRPAREARSVSSGAAASVWGTCRLAPASRCDEGNWSPRASSIILRISSHRAEGDMAGPPLSLCCAWPTALAAVGRSSAADVIGRFGGLGAQTQEAARRDEALVEHLDRDRDARLTQVGAPWSTGGLAPPHWSPFSSALAHHRQSGNPVFRPERPLR